MAALLKFPTEREWETLERFLNNEGCIIIPPKYARKLSSARGSNITDQSETFDNTLIDYDFGGEPDVWVDVAYSGTLSYETVEEHMKEDQKDVTN